MAALVDSRFILRKIRDLRCLTPKRTRVKAKWASTQPKYSPTNMALQYFDSTYGLQLGPRWPSVRAGLLCERRYGALLNNFSVHPGVLADLQAQGCRDFIGCTDQDDQPLLGAGASRSRPEGDLGGDVIHNCDGQGHPPLRLSPRIKCMVFPRGDITRFKPARPDQLGLLGYYLLDAASVLPCLALGVQPGHSVLDLCAAPGGKTLALLQTQGIRFLCLNDVSVSRTSRLKRVLSSYVPKDLLSDERLRVTSLDGTKLEEFERDTFDRVLVDVPCTTDRHSVTEADNNIFSRSRTAERRKLPQLQTELLLAGVRAARPGGEVVYCTCSLSQLQNQFVVEQAIHLARQEDGIHLQVVDLGPLTHMFKDTFHFASGLPLGDMVLPHLAANFGPMYLCKLRRLS